MKNDKARSGFTLLEVMIALVIFCFISLGALGVMSSLLRAQVALEDGNARLDDLQRLLLITRHDITQITPSLSEALQKPPGKTGVQPLDAEGSLAFIRRGWRDPLDESRSTLASVRYDFAYGLFKRRLWPFAQINQPEPSLTQSLADHVEDIHFFPMEKDSGVATATPAAIELRITLPGLGEVRQIIPVAQTP